MTLPVPSTSIEPSPQSSSGISPTGIILYILLFYFILYLLYLLYNKYYLCILTHTPTDTTTKPVTGANYTTYWESFGATFSYVATDILLAQDATITRGLVL